MKKIIEKSIRDHSELLNDLDNEIFNLIESASILLLKAFEKNRKILWCGNGGSASQANHLSAELVGGMYKNKKKPFNSICLNSDTAFITAWANDKSFDSIFSRQLEAIGSDNDILFVLTTSGNSSNIIDVVKFAKSKNIKIISLTGNDGGEIKNYSDINININSSDTQRIQEMHILIGHIICDLVEKSL